MVHGTLWLLVGDSHSGSPHSGPDTGHYLGYREASISILFFCSDCLYLRCPNAFSFLLPILEYQDLGLAQSSKTACYWLLFGETVCFQGLSLLACGCLVPNSGPVKKLPKFLPSGLLFSLYTKSSK